MPPRSLQRDMLASLAEKVAVLLVTVTAFRRWVDPAPVRRPRVLLGLGAACVGPAIVIGRILRRHDVVWLIPSSPAGRAMLLTHVASGAVAEELAWRGVLLLPRHRAVTSAVAVAAGGTFVAGHLRGRAPGDVGVHLLNTASWTLSTLLSRQTRWAAISHTLYNLIVVVLRDADDRRAPEVPA